MLHHVSTPVHGRYLYEARAPERLLVGFHGYAENSERHLEELHKIVGIAEWSVAAIQALHPFYAQKNIVASWMTSLDRELAIADNIEYVRRVLAELPAARTLVFLGYSQGVAMAYRAAATNRCAGLIALAGDVPPELHHRAADLPPILLARGTRDDWYSEERMRADLAILKNVTPFTFEGGHEWTDAFRAAAGEFLRRLSG